MIARVPPSPVSDDQIVRTFTSISIGFCGALVMVGALGAFYLIPDSSVSAAGATLGLALGAVSWFGARWITGQALSRATRPGAPTVDPISAVGPPIFRGIAVAEVPALLGLVLAFADGSEVGPLLVAVPIAVASLVLNISGPVAVRRHLARLRA